MIDLEGIEPPKEKNSGIDLSGIEPPKITNEVSEVQKLKGTPVGPGMPTSVSEMGSPDPTGGVVGLAESVPAMVTGLPAFIVGTPAKAIQSSINALMGSQTPIDDAVKQVDKVLSPFVYDPKTGQGARATKGLTYGMVGYAAPYLLPFLGLGEALDSEKAKEFLRPEEVAALKIVNDTIMLGAGAVRGKVGETAPSKQAMAKTIRDAVSDKFDLIKKIQKEERPTKSRSIPTTERPSNAPLFYKNSRGQFVTWEQLTQSEQRGMEPTKGITQDDLYGLEAPGEKVGIPEKSLPDPNIIRTPGKNAEGLTWKQASEKYRTEQAEWIQGKRPFNQKPIPPTRGEFFKTGVSDVPRGTDKKYPAAFLMKDGTVVELPGIHNENDLPPKYTADDIAIDGDGFIVDGKFATRDQAFKIISEKEGHKSFNYDEYDFPDEPGLSVDTPSTRLEKSAIDADKYYEPGFTPSVLASGIEKGQKEPAIRPYKKVSILQRFKNRFNLDPFPQTQKVSEPVADAGAKVAAALGQGDRIVNVTIQKVFPYAFEHLPKQIGEKVSRGEKLSDREIELYEQARIRNRFGRILVYDRLIGIFKTSREKANVAKMTVKDLETRYAELQDAYRRESAGTLSQASPEILPRLEQHMQEIQEALTQARHDFDYFSKKAKDISIAHDLNSYETWVMKNIDSFKPELELWKKEVNTYLDDLFKETKGLEEGERPDVDNFGYYTGARVNLIHAIEGAPEWESGHVVKNKADSIRRERIAKGPDAGVTRDPWDREAKGTGSYTVSLYGMLRPVVSRRWQAVAKLRFYKQLEESGLGRVVGPDDPAPTGKLGEPMVRLSEPISYPETDPNTGRTRTVLKRLYVRDDIAGEVRQLLMPESNVVELPGARVMTDLQLSQLATDSITHGNNIFTLGNKFFTDNMSRVSSKIPLLSPAEAARRFYKTFNQVRKNDPATLERIREMGENGLLRDGYHVSWLAEKVAKLTGRPGVVDLASGQSLLKMDTAMRILMDDHYQMMVREGKLKDTPTNRRNFILQVGNYNARMMQPWIAVLRRSAVSPYVVAGATYTRNAVRFLTGHPGATPTTAKAGLQLRAEHLIKPMIFGTMLPAMWNLYKVGHWQGRPGTPPGHLDMGGPADENGKFDTFNLMVGTPMDRGLRIIGGQAAWEGSRSGKTGQQILEQALVDAGRSVKHVAIGPGAEGLAVAVTGHDTDFSGRPHRRYQNSLLGKMLEPFRSALAVTSPQFYAAVSGEGPENKGPLGKKAEDAGPIGKRVWSFLDTLTQAPIRVTGFRKSHKARSAAEQEMVDRSVHLDEAPEPETKQSKEAIKKAIYMAQTDELGAIAFLQEKIDKGIVTEKNANQAWKERGLDKIIRDFKRFSVDHTQTGKGSFAALHIYKIMSEEERAQVNDEFYKKIERVWGSADAAKKRELLKTWHSILPEVFDEPGEE